MYQMMKDIKVKKEVQKSKHSFVQKRIGYSFTQLAQRVMQDSQAMSQVNNNKSAVSKAESLRQLQRGASTHPIYMSDSQAFRLSEGIIRDMKVLDEVKEEQQRIKTAQAIDAYKQQVYEEVRKEYAEAQQALTAISK